MVQEYLEKYNASFLALEADYLFPHHVIVDLTLDVGRIRTLHARGKGNVPHVV
jgi:hypothetical protein